MLAPVYRNIDAKNTLLGLEFPSEVLIVLAVWWLTMLALPSNTSAIVTLATYAAIRAIGYGRAARLIDSMERAGIVGPPNGANPREVRLTLEQWQNLKSREASSYSRSGSSPRSPNSSNSITFPPNNLSLVNSSPLLIPGLSRKKARAFSTLTRETRHSPITPISSPGGMVPRRKHSAFANR